ncbi:hypothetical protein DFH09DRAFT_1344997 [Mycena vulgaris]|nr:hypothetical protein DFH09DRAFT_1344997 [Mycena vulgaris]
MATLREIEMRLKSVKNIEKITKFMKIVASTKLAKATHAMQAGKSYGLAKSEVFAHTAPDVEATQKRLFLATCRALNLATDLLLMTAASPLAPVQVDSSSVVMIRGDKSKTQLLRTVRENLRTRHRCRHDQCAPPISHPLALHPYLAPPCARYPHADPAPRARPRCIPPFPVYVVYR